MRWNVIKQSFVNKDLRKRIGIVAGIFFLYRVLSFIPVPTPDTAALTTYLSQLFGSNQFLGFINLFSGGALSNFSIIMVGLSPYITASIIMQLLEQVMPRIKELKKEGEKGRQKVNQYTRILTLPLSIIQSIGFILLIRQGGGSTLAGGLNVPDIIGSPSFEQWVLMVTVLTTGAMLMMWLGELISEQGIGNGISLLIFAGIVAQVPSILGGIVSLVGSTFDFEQVVRIAIFSIIFVGVTYFIVKLNEAQRRITVQYAKRIQGNKAYGGVETTLPIRLITAGVIPIIFAVAFMSVPGFIGQLLQNADTAWVASVAQNLVVWFDPNNLVYAGVYFVLVIMFTYFSVGLYFNPKDISENLQQQGGFIAGVRPGEQTRKYLQKVVNRITLFGSISLALVAVLPFIMQRFTDSAVLTIGGTGLLIVVSVAIETLRQLEAQALTASYE